MAVDKVLHFLVGLWLGTFTPLLGPILATALVGVSAFGKEAWDHYRHGKPDLKDALATVAGGLISVVVFHWLHTSGYLYAVI